MSLPSRAKNPLFPCRKDSANLNALPEFDGACRFSGRENTGRFNKES